MSFLWENRWEMGKTLAPVEGTGAALGANAREWNTSSNQLSPTPCPEQPRSKVLAPVPTGPGPGQRPHRGLEGKS